MKELAAFDFDPDHQPFEDDPVSFRLKPLDMRGRLEIKSAVHAQAWWQGYLTASRYIVGWSGKGLGEFSRARVRQIMDGGEDQNWELWIVQITGQLLDSSDLKDDTAKKS
jgi:hypothetical protein